MKKVILPAKIKSTNGTSEGQVIGSEWNKNGMSRMYVEVSFSKGGNVKCGYVDLETGKINFTSRGVDGKWASKVADAIRIVEA